MSKLIEDKMIEDSGNSRDTICLFLPSLHGGGAEKVMFNLALGFHRMGLKVDLVLARAEGVYLAELPVGIRVIDLNASRVLFSLPGLAKYLRSERPFSILSALDHANVVALLAKKLAMVPVKSVVSVHCHISTNSFNSSNLIDRFTKYWIRPFYAQADAIIAVSQGVAEDLRGLIGLPSKRINVINNPVITELLLAKMKENVDHPWFHEGQPPVILGVGRLTKQKNFEALIRAFAKIKTKKKVRLIVIGEGEERSSLAALIKSLSLEQDVDMPGFVANSMAYMRASAVFVLSSLSEGFGNVLVEAMVCGANIVSTDCPGGPSEILENGRWGTLVPVGDLDALTSAIISKIDAVAPDGLAGAALSRFHENRITCQYLNVIKSNQFDS